MTMIDYDKMEVTGRPIHKVWEDMEKLVEDGLTKSIGVCNCNIMMLVELMAGAKIKPAVVQVELHPYLQQEGLVNTCQRFGIQVTAYAPLGAPEFPYLDYTKTKILDHEILKSISEKHGKTPAQIVLAWNIQRNVIVIPKSSKNERIAENLGALEVKLDEEDIESIKNMNENYRIYNPGMWIEPESGWFNLSDFD
jgi:D-xylose reductase